MTEGIFDLFESVHTPHYSNAEGSQRIADRIDVHRFDYRPELEGVRVALFGVLDGRRSGDNEGCADGSKGIRECLYRLTPHGGWQATVDLGDLRPGLTEEDTAAAVESVNNQDRCLRAIEEHWRKMVPKHHKTLENIYNFENWKSLVAKDQDAKKMIEEACEGVTEAIQKLFVRSLPLPDRGGIGNPNPTPGSPDEVTPGPEEPCKAAIDAAWRGLPLAERTPENAVFDKFLGVLEARNLEI